MDPQSDSLDAIEENIERARDELEFLLRKRESILREQEESSAGVGQVGSKEATKDDSLQEGNEISNVSLSRGEDRREDRRSKALNRGWPSSIQSDDSKKNSKEKGLVLGTNPNQLGSAKHTIDEDNDVSHDDRSPKRRETSTPEDDLVELAAPDTEEKSWEAKMLSVMPVTSDTIQFQKSKDELKQYWKHQEALGQQFHGPVLRFEGENDGQYSKEEEESMRQSISLDPILCSILDIRGLSRVTREDSRSAKCFGATIVMQLFTACTFKAIVEMFKETKRSYNIHWPSQSVSSHLISPLADAMSILISSKEQGYMDMINRRLALLEFYKRYTAHGQKLPMWGVQEGVEAWSVNYSNQLSHLDDGFLNMGLQWEVIRNFVIEARVLGVFEKQFGIGILIGISLDLSLAQSVVITDVELARLAKNMATGRPYLVHLSRQAAHILNGKVSTRIWTRYKHLTQESRDDKRGRNHNDFEIEREAAVTAIGRVPDHAAVVLEWLSPLPVGTIANMEQVAG